MADSVRISELSYCMQVMNEESSYLSDHHLHVIQGFFIIRVCSAQSDTVNIEILALSNYSSFSKLAVF